ncbi:universal stress protein [Propioniciclava soli]|uniref:Universal stress protein n=1 Tax=Propioniciclava soli TaxID=2775081 RepID=A0ABZ3CE37_9ACTN
MSISFDATGALVVGTDLSRRAEQAVDWAAERAAERGSRLLIVLALPEVPIPPRSRLFDAMATPDWPEHLHRAAAERLDALRERVSGHHPEVSLETHLHEGLASYALAQASKTAELVVVGARGEHAPATVRVLGGTADAVVAHARGPVAVITDLADDTPDGPVVVGLDDSAEAEAALRLAVAEALQRRVELVAVHAFDLTPWLPGPLGAGAFDPVPLESALRDAMEAKLAPHRTAQPGLVARVEVEAGQPAHLLAEASKQASLLVVGSRGRGGFAGLLLGSTSKAVLRAARCPVIVTRADDRRVAAA